MVRLRIFWLNVQLFVELLKYTYWTGIVWLELWVDRVERERRER